MSSHHSRTLPSSLQSHLSTLLFLFSHLFLPAYIQIFALSFSSFFFYLKFEYCFQRGWGEQFVDNKIENEFQALKN